MSCSILLLTVTAAWSFSGLLPQNPVSRYRLPYTRALVGSVSFDLSNSGSFPGSGNPSPLGGDVAPALRFRQEDDRLLLDAGLTVPFRASPFSWNYYKRGYFYWLAPRLSGSAEWYPLRKDPSGVPVGFLVGMTLVPSWRTHHCDRESVPDVYYGDTWFVIPAETHTSTRLGLNASGGPAIGRVRDATPVVHALLVEEILRDEGMIEGRLAPDEVEELAEVIGSGWYWDMVSDRYRSTRRRCDELEGFLRRRFPLLGRLPARVWFRIRDVLTPPRYYPGVLGSIPARLTGIRLNPFVELSYDASRETWRVGDDTAQTVTSSRTYFPRLGARLSAGWPLSVRLHLLADADFAWSHDDRYDHSAGLTFSYLTGEVLNLSLELGEWRRWGEGNNRQAWRIVFRPDWFIEDNLTLSGSVRFDAREEGLRRSRDLRYEFGLTWRPR